MSKLCRVRVGSKKIAIHAGDRLIEALLKAGMKLPHDCRMPKCETCAVRVVNGDVLGGETQTADVVRACQAVVVGDVEIEPVKVVASRGYGAEVTAIRFPSRDVAEVTIATERPFSWHAGQSANFRFEGFPDRRFSPTVALDGRDLPGTFRLHVKLIPGGQVSSAIGRTIRRGHRVGIEGPFGTAVLNAGLRGRLALFAGGTGFAPIWSIADRALREAPGRPLLVVVGVRAITSFYMAEALERLARCPSVAVVPIVVEPQSMVPHIETGRVSDLARLMLPGDTVFAAGAREMVAALGQHAARLGLPFHADPFEPSAPDTEGWMTRVAERFAASGRRLVGSGGASSRERIAVGAKGR